MLPTSTEFPNPALYVGDLAPDVTESFLFDMFNRVGPVTSVRLCRDAATRKSLGYAYVNFQRPEDADVALESKNYERIRGRPCRIMRSQRDPTKRKSQAGNVFIKPLHEDVDAKILYDAFSVIGPIESVKVPYKDESISGAQLKARGYGFVQFTNPEHAQAAIDTIKTVSGYPVTIEMFKPRANRDTARQTNVFIKNVPLNYNEEQFKSLFADCGEYNSAKLVTEGDQSKGFGYVNFLDPASAVRCIDKLNGLKLQDAASATDDGAEPPALYATFHKAKNVLLRERQLQRAQGASTKYPQGQNLYVKNLADVVDENVLKTEFSKYGNITSCMIRREPTTKVSMGFGFVCYETPEQAEKALHEILQRTPYLFHGKPLYVALAQNKAQRQEFLRLQRVQFYAQQQQSFQMAQMQGYSAPYGMPPRGDYGQFYPPNPSVPPANLVRQPPQRGYPANAYSEQPQGGRPYGGAGYPMGGPQGGASRGPRGPYMGAGRGGPAYGGRREQGPGGQGPQGGQGRQQWNQQGPSQGPPPQPMMMPMPPQAQPQAQPPRPQPQQPPAAAPAARGLNPTEIARMAPDQAKRLIGENMYPKISQLLDPSNKSRAGKITGMLLEALDNAELLNLLEDNKALEEKLAEALRVLNEAEQGGM
jgi:polyadenylate-binding protein